jgi:hypothetical protein
MRAPVPIDVCVASPTVMPSITTTVMTASMVSTAVMTASMVPTAVMTASTVPTAVMTASMATSMASAMSFRIRRRNDANSERRSYRKYKTNLLQHFCVLV